MGIVNVTPDSFSDGGCYRQVEAAVRHAHRLVADGADIIDIGGESTRPYGNNQPVTAQEEMDRVLPVLERLIREIGVPISLDTYKPATAEAALKMGVHMINDVWGLQQDVAMATVVAKYQVPLIVMHNQEQPGYQDLLKEVNQFLLKSIRIAEQAGIAKENIIIDPGIGFGKTRTDNIKLIRHLRLLEELDCPILLGTSRKAFIGTTLGGLPPAERVEGTAATVAIGIANGADIVRVHDVKEMVRVARMTDALIREELE
jgi:dihydropteroate synthase